MKFTPKNLLKINIVLLSILMSNLLLVSLFLMPIQVQSASYSCNVCRKSNWSGLSGNQTLYCKKQSFSEPCVNECSNLHGKCSDDSSAIPNLNTECMKQGGYCASNECSGNFIDSGLMGCPSGTYSRCCLYKSPLLNLVECQEKGGVCLPDFDQCPQSFIESGVMGCDSIVIGGPSKCCLPSTEEEEVTTVEEEEEVTTVEEEEEVTTVEEEEEVTTVEEEEEVTTDTDDQVTTDNEVTSTGLFVENPLGETSDIGTLLSNIVNFLIKLAIPISAILIVYAGFLYITSAGNEEKVKTAQKALVWAIVGFAVVLIASSVPAIIQEFLSGESTATTTPDSIIDD